MSKAKFKLFAPWSRLRRGCVRTVVLGSLSMALVIPAGATAAPDRAHAVPAFPCSWGWGLTDGLPAGLVMAGNDAVCTGRTGSLTLSIRLLARRRRGGHWHVLKAKTKTWESLDGPRGLSVSARCAVEQVRGVFRWTLRDAAGDVVARHTVRSGVLGVPGPGCSIVLI